MKDCSRPTYQIAMAAGRTSWNDDDRATALVVFDRLHRLADTGDAEMMDACGSSPHD